MFQMQFKSTNGRARLIVFTFHSRGDHSPKFQSMTVPAFKALTGEQVLGQEEDVHIPNHGRAKFHRFALDEERGHQFISVFAFCQRSMTQAMIDEDLEFVTDYFTNFNNMDDVFVMDGMPLIREKYRNVVKEFDSRFTRVSLNNVFVKSCIKYFVRLFLQKYLPKMCGSNWIKRIPASVQGGVALHETIEGLCLPGAPEVAGRDPDNVCGVCHNIGVSVV